MSGLDQNLSKLLQYSRICFICLICLTLFILISGYYAALLLNIITLILIAIGNAKQRRLVTQMAEHLLNNDYQEGELDVKTLYQIGEEYSLRYDIPSIVDVIYHLDKILRNVLFVTFVLAGCVLMLKAGQIAIILLLSYQIAYAILNINTLYKVLR